ncbi:MAG: amidohydrolase family protein, partial [Bacteroidota bacterium]
GILTKALLYLQQFDGLVFSHPSNKYFTSHGQVNESVNSSLTGLKGMPAIGEVIQVQRDLSILEYTGGKLHFNCISTGESVRLIAEARKKGLNVTCDVAAHQIAFDDSMVNTFDTSFKVFPPLRTKEDVAGLLQGLKDGTIDAICSDHTPEDPENKNLEFDLANFGIIGLQTVFAVVNTQLKKHLPINQIIEKISDNPRKLLSIAAHSIEVDSHANLTLFDPELKWTFTEDLIRSKSKNTPFTGQEFTGKPVAVFNKGRFKILS